jgi:peptide/nickel transport system permease protein
MRAKFGLDLPLTQQFAVYVGSVLRGDLGLSYIQGRPVANVIGERIPATLLLTGGALVVSTIIGIALGAVAASRPFGKFDLSINVATLAGYATPSFFLAQLALLFLAFRTGLFPIGGMTDARNPSSGFGELIDVAHHLVLPMFVLAAHEMALTSRLTRARLIEELGNDYARTARSKGLSEWGVMRHALPNALLPVVTVIGGRVGFLFSGAILVEIVFGWPGLGRVLLSAGQTRDYPVLMGLFLLVSFSVVIANLITDLLYGRLDPRIRYE